jgi:predicted enzyme related to lactoylglutathione lyase
MHSLHRLSTPQLITMMFASAAIGATATFMGLRAAPISARANVVSTSQQSDNSTAAKPKEKQKMGCPVVHFEIGCRDTAKTKDFYAKLFDWNIQGGGMSTTIQTGAGKGIDGHITALGHEPEHYTTFYVEVEDIKASLEKAKALGGKTIVPPVAIPTGHFAWMGDPDGNIVGLLQPKKKE